MNVPVEPPATPLGGFCLRLPCAVWRLTTKMVRLTCAIRHPDLVLTGTKSSPRPR